MADWFTENAPKTTAKSGPPFDPTPEEAQMLAQIRARESSGNYSARNPKPGSTAAGAYQFVGPTWQLASQATGTSNYRSAAEAPPAVQDANALYMLRKYGPNADITWAASGPYKQTGNQAAPAPAPTSDLFSKIAAGDITPDVVEQIIRPRQPAAAPAVQPPVQPVTPSGGAIQPGDWFSQNAPPAPQPRSITDELKNQGFLDSAWNAIKGTVSMIGDVFSGEYSKQSAEQLKQFRELEKNGTPEQKREFAKQVVFSNIPGASTAYKATQGNIPGALGDIAGMATLPLAAKVIPAAAGAVKTGASAVADVARSPGVADVVGVASPRAANALRVVGRGVKGYDILKEALGKVQAEKAAAAAEAADAAARTARVGVERPAGPPIWQGPPTPPEEPPPPPPPSAPPDAPAGPGGGTLPSGKIIPTVEDRAALAAQPATPGAPAAPAIDPQFLEDLAQTFEKKSFNRLTDKERANVLATAQRMTQPALAETPLAPQPNARVDIGPSIPGKSIGQMLDEELAARRQAAPPAPAPEVAPPAAVPAPATPQPGIIPGQTVAYTGDQPAVMRSPEAAGYASQLAEELRGNVEPPPEAPVTAAPPAVPPLAAVGPEPLSRAQLNDVAIRARNLEEVRGYSPADAQSQAEAEIRHRDSWIAQHPKLAREPDIVKLGNLRDAASQESFGKDFGDLSQSQKTTVDGQLEQQIGSEKAPQLRAAPPATETVVPKRTAEEATAYNRGNKVQPFVDFLRQAGYTSEDTVGIERGRWSPSQIGSSENPKVTPRWGNITDELIDKGLLKDDVKEPSALTIKQIINKLKEGEPPPPNALQAAVEKNKAAVEARKAKLVKPAQEPVPTTQPEVSTPPVEPSVSAPVETPPGVQATGAEKLPLDANGRVILDLDSPVAVGMRKVDADAQRLIDYSQKLAAPGGKLAVGKEGVNEGFTGWGIRSLLREISRGKSVDEAVQIATKELVDANKLQNTRNPDYVTQFWEQKGVDKIENAAKQLKEAFTKQGSYTPKPAVSAEQATIAASKAKLTPKSKTAPVKGALQHESWRPDYPDIVAKRQAEATRAALEDTVKSNEESARELGAIHGEGAADSTRTAEQSWEQHIKTRKESVVWKQYTPDQVARIKAAFMESYDAAAAKQPPAATSSQAETIAASKAKLMPKSKDNPPISPEIARRILDEETPLPEGWYVHGRSGGADISENWPVQLTQDVPTASGYAGSKGSVHLVREKPGTKVADFTSTDTVDMNGFIKSLRSAFKLRTPEVQAYRQAIADSRGVKVNKVSFDDFAEHVRDDFTPSRIVHSAQAFDNDVALNLLKHYPGGWPSMVKTPDGAIVIPGELGKVETINLSRLASGAPEAPPPKK